MAVVPAYGQSELTASCQGPCMKAKLGTTMHLHESLGVTCHDLHMLDNPFA
jgi:hypothetical protein